MCAAYNRNLAAFQKNSTVCVALHVYEHLHHIEQAPTPSSLLVGRMEFFRKGTQAQPPQPERWPTSTKGKDHLRKTDIVGERMIFVLP